MSKKFEKGKMVEFPSTAIIPERDLDKTPVLECRHLGIDFGGLRAVDDFNLTIGRTEIAGLEIVVVRREHRADRPERRGQDHRF